VVLIVHYSHNSGRRRSVAPWTLFYHETHYAQLGWFTLVWYSAKQGTTLRPTSHLVHLYTVPFLWPQD